MKYKNEIRVVSLPKGGRKTTNPKILKKRKERQRKDTKKSSPKRNTKQACNKQHTENVFVVAHHTHVSCPLLLFASTCKAGQKIKRKAVVLKY